MQGTARMLLDLDLTKPNWDGVAILAELCRTAVALRRTS